ncbi:NAD(P)H-quinone oxidoreductase subunit I [Synechococcus sp. CCY9201]|uniref:NAD(P)H-quinone oxidoreductase subunit I n=1 Tax=unclassified Synechococcus TaxID=2626047 RepID=UPI0018CD7488|nr:MULTISPECIES: NAD(P)H-quinone oxidoreductase subunit I [unclassified Synechococcus]MEA5424814.1 NAD(P)H-quinone oxidoreductase subunit I [Synechococcus sp. CCY9202]MEA5475820.1 NAD(P)H-quinone oxidoreductase subunit I [Synechococcus sp. CCY9201]QPN67918.1 NAD(P)H-quinone oxidoreductase subunit I [Synechococcus sp. CBW1006]CAK6689527.1 NAD(P)H-quinone oxidoreductase subunit I [Synechococcus sp. CBW1107]
MFGFLKKVSDYTRDAVGAAQYMTQGLAVTFDHLRRRPITVQYPYEKLIPSERYRGRIHYEFDKCIACEVCVRVCPINLPVVDWVMNKATKKKELRNYSIDFGVCIFCGNCVEYCPTNCLSMTEEYELSTFDRHSLNYDNIALGRLPTSVTSDPAVFALRELAYLPQGVMDPHDVPATAPRAGKLPEQVLQTLPKAAPAGETQADPGAAS